MIKQEILSEIIDSQRRNFSSKRFEIDREILSNISISGGKATVITGLRRCGKCTLMLQIQRKDNLLEALYLNFEDIRLAGFEINDFQRLHNEIELRGVDTLFFDEIHIVPGWNQFINRLLIEDYHVIISDANTTTATTFCNNSNTKSSDLDRSHSNKKQCLKGKIDNSIFQHIELFPFSFSEYLDFTKQVGNQETLIKYLRMGGMPKYIKHENNTFLGNLLDDILVRDISVRKSIRDIDSLRRLAAFLLSNISKPISANSLTGMFGIRSCATVVDYFNFFRESYLIEMVPQFSISSKAESRNPKKIYAIDLGLINIATTTSLDADNNKRLENLVYIHLRTNPLYNNNIKYYINKWSGDCDFITTKHKSATQVAWKIDDDNRDEEFRGLTAACEELGIKEGTLVTCNQKDTIEYRNFKINIIPAWEYLQYRHPNLT